MGITVITGANRGIGLELATQLSERGNTVVALVRRASPALQALDVEIIDGVDVTDDDLSAVAKAIGERSIDILINNAGLLERTTIDDMDLASIRRQFEVNTLGPLKVTHALLGNLSAGSKVAHVTSRMGSIEDNTSGSHYGYRMSKTALNMACKSMSLDLAGRGISVCVLHPGFVRTEMTGNSGYIDADEAARGLIARVDDLSSENSGSFWHQNGESLPW
jgi:NAD(P)-dependent dehydrogenase (short-subunit alcohol dehydrogenase family)